MRRQSGLVDPIQHYVGAMARHFAGAVVLALFAHAAVAQTPPPLAKGARVRLVQVGADRRSDVDVTGTLLSLSADTVRIAIDGIPGNAAAYVLDTRRHLEVASETSHSVGRRAIQGMAVGAVGVGVLAALSYQPCHSTSIMGCMFAPGSPLAAGAIGAVGGALGGLVVGAIIGLVSADVTWVPAPTAGVHVAVTPLPAGHLGLGASISF
jgi:hypothetical protein